MEIPGLPDAPELSEPPESAAEPESPVEPEPPTAEEWFARGRAFEDQKLWFQAREAYCQAAALDPDNPRIHFRCGYMSERRREWRVAVSHYRFAIRLLPRSAIYHFRMGFALEKMRLWEEAVHCYAIAALLDRDTEKHRTRLPHARDLMSFVRDHRPVGTDHLSALHDGAEVISKDLTVTGVYTAKCRLHEVATGAEPKRIFEKLIMPHRAAFALREVIANEELAALDTPPALHFPALVSTLRVEDGVRMMFFEHVDVAPPAEVEAQAVEAEKQDDVVPLTAVGTEDAAATEPGANPAEPAETGTAQVVDVPPPAVAQLERLIKPLVALALTDTGGLNLARLASFDGASENGDEDGGDDDGLFGEIYRRKLMVFLDSPAALRDMERFIIDNAIFRKREELVTDYATELADLLQPVLPQIGPVYRALSGALGHGDLKPDNVLFDRAGRAVLIDWQYLSLLPAGYDLARFATWSGLEWRHVDPVARRYAEQLQDRFDPDQVIWSVCLCYALDALVSRPGWVQETHRTTLRPALDAIGAMSNSISGA